MVDTVTENQENTPVEDNSFADSPEIAGQEAPVSSEANNNFREENQQSLNNQPAETNSNPLLDEAREYGFSDELINNLPPDQLNRVMMEFDRKLLSSPNGMMGQQQQQQSQNFQQQQATNQPEAPQVLEAPNWDDDDIYDPDQAKGMKYLHQQIQQMQGYIQQQAQQVEMQQFIAAIDGLNSEVLSSDRLDSKEMQLVAPYYDQFRQMGLNPDVAVKRAARALGIPTQEELKSAALQRSSQFSGSPARSSNGQFQSAVDLVRDKLADAGGNTVDMGSDFEGFLN